MSPFSRPAAIHQGDRLLARSVFLLLLAIYTATFTGLPENPDSETEFQTVSSLVRTGSLALGGTPEAQALIGANHALHVGGPGREDKHYSWFGVGQALGAVPFYLAGRALHRLFPQFEERNSSGTYFGSQRSEYFEHLVVGWRNPLLTAMTAWLIVITARRLGAGRRSAWVAALAYGSCTFAWPQARATLSDVQATFLLFLAFHQLVKVRERYARGRLVHRTDLALFGLALGGAFLTRLVTAPAIAVLLVALVVVLRYGIKRLGNKGRPLMDLLTALVPAVLCLVLWLWINHLRFGSVLESGYGDAVGSSYFSYPPLLGLAMLLAAPGKGLLFLAPITILALPWLGGVLKHTDPLGPLLVSAMIVAVFGPIVATEGWHGAWNYGPRYVLPVMPFLMVGVAQTLKPWGLRPRLRWAAPFLCGVGLFTALPGVVVDYTAHHDLAIRAARIEWPELPGESDSQRDGARFLKIHQDWRFAAPYAHWRILRHRFAIGNESYPVREIFLIDDDAILEPSEERFRGFQHLAWVDFQQRLGGSQWIGWVLSLLMGAAGLSYAARGLDRTLN
ncbi:MAG: hypothetical protein ACI8QS_003181 [Planctomycetota bacterium]|jgi:hypothetical protein